MRQPETLERRDVTTPFLVIDLDRIREQAERIARLARKLDIYTLFPLKAICWRDTLCLLSDYVSGFATSSLFEVMLASSVRPISKNVHFTSPGLRESDVDRLAELCTAVSFNSVGHFLRYGNALAPRVSCGLRVNPELSLVSDPRYDSCRPHSKLGMPLSQVAAMLEADPAALSGLEGIHFHNNCESGDFSPLLRTVERTAQAVPGLLHSVRWVNLGGGYVVESDDVPEALERVACTLVEDFDCDVFFEPGRGFVGDSAYLVSEVVDIFDSGGKTIAVLDTTVNHWPEVFEYQFEPEIANHSDDGEFGYILAGCSCLAGDVFGEYAFKEPLTVGSRVAFSDAAAYTLVKAHMFNGINLPTICLQSREGGLRVVREFTYLDFVSRWEEHAGSPNQS